MAQQVKLETPSLILGFNRATGSLESLYSKSSDWFILDRAQLALSWRLMLPLKGRRNNNAWGHLQSAAPVCTATATKICFDWAAVESEFGGTHPISVHTECALVKGQAVFRMRVKNASELTVENVYYPYLGDLHRPKDSVRFGFHHGGYCALVEHPLYPVFPNCAGTHSVDYPTLAVESHINPPMNPFGYALDEQGNGLYFGVAERRLETATWHAECHPGWEDSLSYRVFDTDSADGQEHFTRFAVGHLPFIAPHAEFELLPFGLEAFKGNWSTAAACYTRVSAAWSHLPAKMPTWAKEPHSWLQVQINSPEDELRTKFRDLPTRIGKECAAYGVEVIQLVGWNEGGQDRGNPSHSPDPRLGTFAELRAAIQEIRAMGVKLILFAKFNWADQSLPDFEEVYAPMATKDPYGNYYVYKGYQYMTLSQMTDVNTRRLIPMCFGSEDYLQVCKREFQKCLDLGADGILYDECLHHSPTLCCFDTGHGHRYGECSYQWDERLIDTFREMAGDREFMIAGEAVYDFQHNYYDVSYTRTWGKGHIPVNRFLRPDGQIMTAVTGFNDRSMINQCLLNRYIISYEPYNFKGNLSDYPRTVAYGKKMDRLRTELRAFFWDGSFLDTHGGQVALEDGSTLSSYAVYRAADGRLGMIVCNYEETPVRVKPVLEVGTLSQYRLVDEDAPRAFTDWIELPARSAAAVI